MNKPSLPRRSPQDKKRLDYKHEMRPLEPGAASRKLRKQLPPLERKKYRRALDTITRAALRDDEAAKTLAEDLHATKRAHFTYLRPRRKVSSLGEVVHSRSAGGPIISRLGLDAGIGRSSDAVPSGDRACAQ